MSGLDHAADGRSFATLDFDGDGLQDLVVANKNGPSLLLYRNELGAAGAAGGFAAFRFVGGNAGAEPSTEWSARDGYGAVVSLALGDALIEREHRCGEGLAAQNSATLLVGLGAAERIDAVTVRWPSGRSQRTEDVPAGTLVTVYEDPSRSPTGEVFVREPYGSRATAGGRAVGLAEAAAKRAPAARVLAIGAGELRMLTTMATWCASCRRELPQLATLRAAFEPEELAMYGVPIDENDTPARLAKYADAYRPAYELLAELSADEVAEVARTVHDGLGSDGLPATVLTDGEGRVLRTMWGVPTISEVRALLGRGR